MARYVRYLLAVVAAGLLLELAALFVPFLLWVLFFVAFFADAVVFEEDPAGEAALLAWAANVRGIVATANAIAANIVFFISFLPAGLARSQLHHAPPSVLTR